MATNSAASIVREFQQAVEDFKRNLTEKERKDFEITELKDLEKAMIDLQKRQAQKKRLAYMKRLEPFLESMKEYEKVIEVFLNASGVLAFVWGPMKFILLASKTKYHALLAVDPDSY
ncbi:hypothetical protein F5B19DRAFT_471754 [Rostrohypoxylon terebratum]|nr:hypothetical protein F5B19DRAFT_471754 [Rostrohypoxylon terebratum]